MWNTALLAASCIALSYAGEPLPPYIKPCARSDPNINECAVKHGNEAIPHILKGNQKFKIPSLDPFDIKELKIIDDGSRSAGISITLRNAKVYGPRNTRLIKTSMNLDKGHNRFEAMTSKVNIIGEYEASGRILLLPISGKGNVNLTTGNMYFVYDEYWQLEQRDGEAYMVRDNVTVTGKTPQDFHIQITNLFNGNKFLGDQMNIFLNENWKDAFKELSPTVFKVMSEIIGSVVNRLSAQVSFDNIFPEKVTS